MSVELSILEDYALVFQQQIRSFREKLDLESKSTGAMGEDRISELPNTILCHILSLIQSTKQVVRTNVLSTKWKDISASVPNLYFNRDEFSSSADFIAFVDRVLLVRDSSAIQKFHLHFKNCRAEDFSRVDGWISTAVKCNVVEVDLSVSTPVRYNVEEQEEDDIFELPEREEDDMLELPEREEDDMFELPEREDNDMFELPISLLTCKTLKKLSLRSMIIIKMPTSVSNCFPSLEFLHIHFKVIDPRPTISMDLLHFPVLEYLSIDGDLGYTVLDCSISAPELKILRIDLYSPYNLDGPYNISIDALKLEKLDHHLGFVLSSNMKNTESLVAANIDLFLPHSENDVEEDSVDQATEFLAQISVVKHLTIAVSIDQGFSVPLPFFGNLSKLTLHHFGCSHWWRILMELLERSPNLECLEIDDWFYPTHREMEKEAIRVAEQKKKVIRVARRKKKVTEPTDREVLVIEPTDREVVVAEPTNRGVVVIDLPNYVEVLNWIPPETVPSCLSSRLKTISIKGFKGNGYSGDLDEMALTKYLLKHGQVLEKLTIYTPGLHRIYNPGRRKSTTDEVYGKLSVVEMGSNAAEVEIFEEMFYRSEGGSKISIFS